MGRFIIILSVVLTLMPLIFSVKAESTFFDDTNNAFIMGNAGTAGNEATAQTSQQTGGSGSGHSCPEGYNFTNGECINITSISGISLNEDMNTSPTTILPPQQKEANTTKEYEEVEEQQLIMEKPSGIPSIDRKKFWYNVLAGGIMLLVAVYVFHRRRRKKQPHVNAKNRKILTK